jgi:hypothetical protein
MPELEVLGNGHLVLDFADWKEFFESEMTEQWAVSRTTGWNKNSRAIRSARGGGLRCTTSGSAAIRAERTLGDGQRGQMSAR